MVPQYVVPFATPVKSVPHANTGGGIVSINAGEFNDLNLQGAITAADASERPVPVTLPFLEDFPPRAR